MSKKISIIGVPMDLVEMNPIFDVANKTSLLAVELILSALGKRIL